MVVSRISIGFYADQDPGEKLPTQKVNFYMKNKLQ
jgi:hypothetical protein